MKPKFILFLRLTSILMVGLCVPCLDSLAADDISSPLISKQFSAELTQSLLQGHVAKIKIFFDNGKCREEMHMEDDKVGVFDVVIFRHDQKKLYFVGARDKSIGYLPLDLEDQLKTASVPDFSHDLKDACGDLMTASGMEGKRELVGPETVNGVACTKYKLTTQFNHIYFIWLEATKNIPIKLAPENGSTPEIWKNYESGPQDASLFELPAGYKMFLALPGGE